MGGGRGCCRFSGRLNATANDTVAATEATTAVAVRSPVRRRRRATRSSTAGGRTSATGSDAARSSVPSVSPMEYLRIEQAGGPQRRQGAARPALHGADAAAQDGGGLLLAEIVEEPQHEDGPLGPGQSPQGDP